jgi:hypothetical protein
VDKQGDAGVDKVLDVLGEFVCTISSFLRLGNVFAELISFPKLLSLKSFLASVRNTFLFIYLFFFDS